MIKRFNFDYAWSGASATLEVKTEQFTEKDALSFLNFFVWDWNPKADVVEEAMKKIALRCILEATRRGGYESAVIRAFDEIEGYPKIDGSEGITLTHVEEFEFVEEDLELTISDVM